MQYKLFDRQTIPNKLFSTWCQITRQQKNVQLLLLRDTPNGCLYTSSGIGNSDSQLRIPHREHCIPDPEGRCIEKVVSDLKSKVRTEIAPITALYDESVAMLSQTLTAAHAFLSSVNLILPCIERD